MEICDRWQFVGTSEIMVRNTLAHEQPMNANDLKRACKQVMNQPEIYTFLVGLIWTEM